MAVKWHRGAGMRWLWIGGAALLFAANLALGFAFWQRSEADRRAALTDGRSAAIVLASGEIVRPAASASESKSPETAPAPEAPPEQPPEESSAAPSAEALPTEQAAPSPPPPDPSASPPDTAAALPPPAENTSAPAAKTQDPAAGSLSPAPAPELTETSELGPLPIVAPSGAKAWQHYALPFDLPEKMPVVSIVVAGLGHSKSAAEAALALPAAVSLSFSPYAKGVTNWITAARAGGHEVLIDLPAEPHNYPASDPGPKAMLVANTMDENEKRLLWILSRFPGYIGVTIAGRERFTENAEGFFPVLRHLARRGLMLVLGDNMENKKRSDLLAANPVPHLIATLQLDDQVAAEAVAAQLAELEAAARKNGAALGVARAYPVTVQQLATWTAGLKERGIVLAPASALARKKFP